MVSQRLAVRLEAFHRAEIFPGGSQDSIHRSQINNKSSHSVHSVVELPEHKFPTPRAWKQKVHGQRLLLKRVDLLTGSLNVRVHSVQVIFAGMTIFRPPRYRRGKLWRDGVELSPVARLFVA